ncbi:MAG: 4-(cytidine 5'-diphospho)-2-C-methyl-D-erythritol kinase [Flavobacteriales bacterium]|nr:4-(cytidine 5'-diphospho)-2-C-methyl-D-erythritol kinase [Flavobacteriales bacterium]
MLAFPNAKINIGLNIIERRTDGFHNIESMMVPIPLCDTLEIVRDKKGADGSCDLQVLGLTVEGSVTENLCFKAYEILNEKYSLPAVKIRLLKNIPMGAGLGGGSSDAAFTVKLLNELFDINLSNQEMEHFCAMLGSDCSFFIRNECALASGKGEIIEPVNLGLSGIHVVVIHPGLHINTAQAYAGIIADPSKKGTLTEALSAPNEQWKISIRNDFEEGAITRNPELGAIKDRLYEAGAFYACMTGSGSSFFGLFDHAPTLELSRLNQEVWVGKLK